MGIGYDVTLDRSPSELTSELFLLIRGAGHSHGVAGNTGYIVPAAFPLTKLWLPSSRLNSAAARSMSPDPRRRSGSQAQEPAPTQRAQVGTLVSSRSSTSPRIRGRSARLMALSNSSAISHTLSLSRPPSVIGTVPVVVWVLGC